MSSLQEQLKRLTVPHVQHSLEGKKTSLLFDSREVQAVDREVLFEVASNALKELISINSTFKKYEDFLFHKNQLSIDRTLQDKKFNAKLNKVVKQYLIELSPYFMMKNAQKTLEWLVHHYKIELFNIDDLIMTFLPFHQTNIFVRLLMMLDLEKPSYKWHWLNQCAKNGIQLPKSLVLNQCKKDSSFLQSIFSMVDEYVEVMGAQGPNLSLVVDHCNIIALLLMDKQSEVPEEVVSTLMQYVLKALKSKNQLREVGSYPIIATLASRVSLKEEKVLQLCKLVSKHLSEEFFSTALLCLSVLVSRQQDHVNFPADILKHLTLNELQLHEVEEFAQTSPTSPLLKLLSNVDESGVIKSLLDKIQNDDVGEMEVEEEGCGDVLDASDSASLLKQIHSYLETEDPSIFSSSLTNLLSNNQIDKKDVTILRSMIKEISHKTMNLEEKVLEIKIEELLKLETSFCQHSSKVNYINCLLLSELFNQQSALSSVNSFITLNALSHQVFTGMYSKCTKTCFQDPCHADMYTPVNFNDAGSTAKFYYKQFQTLVDHLKDFNATHPEFKDQYKIMGKVFLGVFHAPKHNTIKKEVVAAVFKHFSVSHLVTGYCQYLCEVSEINSENKGFNIKLDEYVTSSRHWFLKILKSEPIQISDQLLTCMILLLSHESNEMRGFVMNVLEVYSGEEVIERSSLRYLIKKLFVFKDEMHSDSSVLSQVLSSKFSSDSELSSGMQQAYAVVAQLIDESDFKLKYSLLCCLRTCKNQEFVSKVLAIASSSLNQIMEGVNTAENIMLFEVSMQCLSKTKKKFMKSQGFFKVAMQLLSGDLAEVGKEDKSNVMLCLLQNVTEKTFGAFSAEDQKEMVAKLVEVALNKDMNVLKSVSECLRGLNITSDIIESLFNLTKEESPEASSKKRKLEVPLDVAKVTFVLEFLNSTEVMDKSTDMCALLGKALTQLSSKENTNYPCQLILTCLHRIITSLGAAEAQSYESCLNIEALVQCLRRTSNFQTQQHIVLVMTAISPFFPDQLLNNIISIFAFMGDNFVQKDDSYSFQILTKLINVALLAVEKLSADNPRKEGATINIFRVFVDARKHIPQHRLIPLFNQLLSIDADQYLWKLMILIIESISLHKEEYKQKMSFEYDIITSFFSKYPLQTQLTVLTSLIKFLIGYLDALDLNSKKSIDVVGPLVATSTDTRFITLHLNKAIYNILSDIGFSRRFLKMLESGTEDIEREVFQGLINSLVQYILSINKKQKTVPHEIFWPALLKIVNINLKRVNYLIPASIFIDVLECLLSQDIVTVKCKGLELLYAKLDLIDQNEFEPSDYSSVIKLVPLLLSNLQSVYSEKDKDNKQVFYIQQLSFLNLKILCKCYGCENKAVFSELPLCILKFLESDSNNIAVLDSSLFCLSEVVVLMKSKMVPHLNRIMLALTALFKKEEMLEKTISLDCLLSVFNKIIFHLGQFISPFLDQLISQLCCLPADKLLHEKLNEKMVAIAKTVETRLLIPSLMKTYHGISSPSGYLALFKLLKTHLETAGKEQLVGSSKAVSEFICVLMNLRNDAVALSAEEVEELEQLYLQSALAFVVHLSEVSFRPLLEKLYNAMDKDISKTITFFHLMCALSTKLKSIFNLFSGFLIKLIVKLLNHHNSSSIQEGESLHEKVTEVQSAVLVGHILRLVTMCYSCDVDGAFALSTADALFVPVVDQLENLKEGYEERIDGEVIPCLVQICQSIKQNTQLMALNKLICHKSKHEDWRVRLGAVKCLKALVESLGNLYEMLFPETASYLSELLEDDKEDVAQESRLFRGCLEKVIGNLEHFF